MVQVLVAKRTKFVPFSFFRGLYPAQQIRNAKGMWEIGAVSFLSTNWYKMKGEGTFSTLLFFEIPRHIGYD